MIPPSVRARTVLATSSHVELGILSDREVAPSHLVDPEGAILLHPGEGHCWDRLHEGAQSPQLDLIASDVTSVPQPDRIRALVRLRGRVSLVPAPAHRQVLHLLRLAAGQPMARFVPDSVALDLPSDDGRRTVMVPLPAYSDASADPLAGWESVWTTHLDAAHGESLRRLAQRRTELTDTDSVRALQADSSGLTVRVYSADSQRDVRFDFTAPARCGCRAVAAFKELVAGLDKPGPSAEWLEGGA